MHTPTSACILLLLAGCTLPRAQADPAAAAAARALLDAAYASRQQPDLEPLLRQLGSDDRAVRAHAGAVLHELLLQLDADRRAGRSPPREPSQPKPARTFGGELCWRLAEGLATTPWPADATEAEAAALWLFHQPALAFGRSCGLRALVRIRSPAADDVVRQVLQEGRGSLLAIQAAAAHGMRDLLPQIVSLRGDSDPDVRLAADAAARVLGWQEPPSAFEGVKLPPSLLPSLELAAELVAEPLPAGARWCRVTPTRLRLEAFEEVEEVAPLGGADPLEGWLLQPADRRPLRLLLPWGAVCSFDGTTPKVAEATLAGFAHQLLAMRARFAQVDQDERVYLAQALDVPEHQARWSSDWPGGAVDLLVAAWLHRAGDDALAARVLMPLLPTTDSADAVCTRMLRPLAATLAAEMVQAFAIDRDFPRALAMARQLMRPECPWFDDQRLAEALAPAAAASPRRLPRTDAADRRRMGRAAPAPAARRAADVPGRSAAAAELHRRGQPERHPLRRSAVSRTVVGLAPGRTAADSGRQSVRRAAADGPRPRRARTAAPAADVGRLHPRSARQPGAGRRRRAVRRGGAGTAARRGRPGARR